MATPTRIFLTGASGYIGGDVLHALHSAHPEYIISTLVRDPKKAATLSQAYPNIRIVSGDLDSTSLIEEEAHQADVVVHTASSSHIESVKAIARGLAERSDPGASVLSIADIVNGTYGEGTDKVFGDVHDADAVREIIRQNATRRVVDNFILNLTAPKTALVFAPIIYGQGRGIIKQRSIQIPELARVAIETGRAVQVGKGESTWSHVHISDVSDLFIKLVEKAVQKETDERMWNQEGLYFPGNSMLSFKGISELLAQTAHRLGLIESPLVFQIDHVEADKLSPHGGILWGSINASLAEIDLRTKDLDNPPTGDIIVGPFAVLGLPTPEPQRGDNVVDQQAQQDAPDSTSVESDAHLVQPVSSPTIEDSSETIGQLTAYAQASFISDSACHFDDFLHWSDLLGYSPDALGWNPTPLSNDMNLETNLAALGSEFEIDPMPFDRTENIGPFSHAPDGDGSLQMVELPHNSTGIASTLLHAASLTDAPFLFKHFHDNVIPQTMPMPRGMKSPWKILNVPAAMGTYSDLTILGSQNISHARQANLYGLLACSAVHLSMYPSPHSSDAAQHWQETAENLFEQAREHMKMSVKYETQKPKRAKYKDQLMAICCLTEYAILSAQQHYTRGFLINAEYILRTRGLPKRRISPKARLLHHVYTWQRLVGESTYVLHDYEPSASFIEALDSDFRPRRPDPRSLIGSEADQSVPQLDDFLRLEAHHSDSDLNIDDPKDQQTGLHDIHLQDSRNFSDTLYKQIYGIPETWLTLVSQTTRLANVMETFRIARQSQRKTSLEAWEALHRRSEHLENMICSFVLRYNRRVRPEHLDSSEPHEPMLRALNGALVIFFYRRVRQAHPAVLAGYVDNVITALAEFQKAVPADHPMSPATAWPMFIAGCEALTASRRDAVLQFFNRAESICRFPVFKTASEILTNVWNQQDQHLETNRRDPMPTWIDIVREKQTWLLLC
ncbi:hypothetical protein CNMCM5793_000852 [Aspergillus hiratsukae]|uniref:NAD-dependent epimerase/dehydratase domain-containing protein n=1 Tax=Aspergillus hiratsukae TaxID=1194566 RepID=A0A8H6USZ3_9EURO|nr:hypothetical protein CNMCM5793_000852 [Aspergillus hiratsukae]KAF7163094.1 hypothetical protein CNMCM6106_000126 [Aspergillus hiratsukae]